MNRDEQKKNNKPSWLPAILAAIFILFSVLAEMDEEVILTIFVILFILIPVIVVIAVLQAFKKKSGKNEVHSHDRIDHRKDLKVNTRTGKVEERPVYQGKQHSKEEHWKQQLDGLLANGTIDRAEYKAMMKRKF